MTLASRTGTLARRLLEQAGRGRVLAATKGAIYLRTGSGEIVWIQGRGSPMHRRGIELSTAAVPRVAAGEPFQVERETLRVDHGVCIDLAGASTWEPVDSAGEGAHGAIGARMRDFFDAIDEGSARELGCLIPSLRRLFEGSVDAAPAKTGDPVLDAAVPLAIGAARAVRDRDPAALEDHASALVGLGRGTCVNLFSACKQH